jgi:molybdate transport system substrate-binding protein
MTVEGPSLRPSESSTSPSTAASRTGPRQRRRSSPEAPLALILILFMILAGCGSGGEDSASLTVFCGSASKPAMEQIATRFESETGIAVKLIFGGSGTLLSQIELSGQGEIYLPGSPDYIIIGNRKGLLIEGSERIVSYLVPAIITPEGNPADIHSLEDLARPGLRIGIGNPQTVCLGLYAIELLERNGLLDEVMKNVVTFGGSCSKTANLAAMSQVDAILGWKVFESWNTERTDYVSIAPQRIPRLSYIPIAIPVHTKDIELSLSFIEFVLSTEGRSVYEDLGYLTELEAARALAPGASVGGEYSLPQRYFELLEEL